ncbi:hypothetical protein RUM44_003021 [Polyplax serrata]|uniref:Uncharacterized protein n=1 Tax=Polyplax serrata TaxID=468196 RepID=A0ABR1AXB6_POLSC
MFTREANVQEEERVREEQKHQTEEQQTIVADTFVLGICLQKQPQTLGERQKCQGLLQKIHKQQQSSEGKEFWLFTAPSE